jgi:hypothetical protein
LDSPLVAFAWYVASLLSSASLVVFKNCVAYVTILILLPFSHVCESHCREIKSQKISLSDFF